MLDELKMSLLRAQHKMKVQADGARQDVKFDQGDLVYLKLHPYRQKSLAQRKYEKLAARYFGPYPVVERIRVVAYCLKLPPTACLHPVYHISQLKCAIGAANPSWDIPQQLTAELTIEVEAETATAVRKTSMGQVRLSSLGKICHHTKLLGNPLTKFSNIFLISTLRTRCFRWGGSNDRPPIHFTYARRSRKS
ncbi:hypothetical protein PanWU01x14_021760 [Parasponia andersonii]|uniref:Tf2-1-like SH3-like domain-containing protein n=1 Tax=Parasponia andersonii TaxID=3476 RepID=A0A2P5DY20_PARAD|nr:hypothetical protein PanWU01x14_021760 [Parasponia andersonii]